MRMETARLILRPWEEADAQALWLASDLITAQQSAIERLKAFL